MSGNLENTLSQPNQVALTQSASEKLFGPNSPIGQRIRLDNMLDLEVTAVIADLPSNTSLPANMLISFASITEEFLDMPLDDWGFSIEGCTFVKLPQSLAAADVEARFPDFIKKHFGDEGSKEGEFLNLQPIGDIHFDSRFDTYTSITEPFYLQIFTWVGLFILLMAAINFTNLSTAFALRRSQEVGVRKVIGAQRGQLVGQLLGETGILVALALLISVLLVEVSLPWLNTLFDLPMSLAILPASGKLAFFGGLFLLMVLLSGLYPAMLISGFQPLKVLNGRTGSSSTSTAWLRKGLVVVQFTVAIALVIALTLLGNQMEYFKNKSLGFNKETVLTIQTPERKGGKSLQNQLAALPEVQSVSLSSDQPMGDDKLGISMPRKIGSEDKLITEVIPADANYQTVYEMEMAAGRWFTWQDTALIYGDMKWEERQFRYVVNEALAKELGYATPEDILHERIQVNINSIQGEVIGVVKDFHTESMRDEIGPVAFLNFPPFYGTANIKLSPNTIASAVPKIEKIFSGIYPAAIFEYNFVDDAVERHYETEARIFSLFKIFSGVAFIICCLGLWGLITFLAEQKTKEIGIRKVLGASVPSIIALLSKDFLKLVGIAILVASPLAWYFMDGWLQNFAYRIEMEWWVFALAGFVAIGVTFLTVSFQSVKAALMNPVESLRSE